MSRKLDDLDPTFRPKAVELLARCVENGLAVCIVTTRRTPTEQAEAVRRGVSWTMNSKHLAGMAIDLCPYDLYQLHGPDKLKWDDTDPAWSLMGRLGINLGLKWGITRNGIHMDLGHFEAV